MFYSEFYFMVNTKLIQLLRHLHASELQKFQHYVQSDYFSVDKKAQKLLQYLLLHAPDYADKNFNKQTLYSKIYPTKKYDDAMMNSLLSTLLHHLYRFQALETFRSDDYAQWQIVFRKLTDTGLESHAKAILKKAHRVLQKQKDNSIDKELRNVHFYRAQDHFFVQKRLRQYDENLQLANDTLDIYYLTLKLRIACDMTTRNQVIQANYQYTYIEEIEKLTSYILSTDVPPPALQTYYAALQMMRQPENDSLFTAFKDILEKNTVIFPPEELWILYNYALNHCIQRINSGNQKYYHEIHAVYRQMLTQKIILQNGILTQWDYKNIVTTGVRIKDYEWTKGFILEYKNKLPQKDRENAVAYNLASLYLATEQYDLALQQLQDVKFTDASYHIGAKIIQLKCYFSLDESEPFYSLIDAFFSFIYYA